MIDTSDRVLQDLGPVYYETDLDRFIVEPFNAFSSLSMPIAALLIWLLLIRKDFNSHTFLAFIYTPLIIIGGIGSTFFHAFRASPIFLYLDVIPVFIVTILLSLFYWYKIYPKWYFILLMVFIVIGSRVIPMRFFQGATAINVSYFLSGLLILAPLIIFLFRTEFQHIKFVIFSVLALLLALLFRYTDDFNQMILPMGTHWLWHIFTGIGAWFLGIYIYRSSES